MEHVGQEFAIRPGQLWHVANLVTPVDIVVAVAVVVVVNVNVVVVLGFGVVLVTWSARFEGILSLAVDAVEQEL